MRTLVLLFTFFLTPIPVFSQDQGLMGEIKNMNATDVASAAQKAVEQLTSAAQDKLLIKDLLFEMPN